MPTHPPVQPSGRRRGLGLLFGILLVGAGVSLVCIMTGVIMAAAQLLTEGAELTAATPTSVMVPQPGPVTIEIVEFNTYGESPPIPVVPSNFQVIVVDSTSRQIPVTTTGLVPGQGNALTARTPAAVFTAPTAGDFTITFTGSITADQHVFCANTQSSTSITHSRMITGTLSAGIVLCLVGIIIFFFTRSRRPLAH